MSYSFLLTSLTLSLISACGNKETEDEVETIRIEGTEAGDCIDGADNDGDGDFDCDDSGCENSPDCEEEDTAAVDPDDPDDLDDDGDGFSENQGDCDDTNAAISPEATDDTVDGIDQNCDDFDGIDQDQDGFASVESGGTDCDDTNSAINTAATEVWYDGTDQNCDGLSDYDQDGDGEDSDQHSGTDCDDTDASIYLGAIEIIEDGIDQDCDGSDDVADNDNDGYDNTVDCDDSDDTVYPGAPELCDGLDNDCDLSLPTNETDDDNDGFVECSFDVNGWDGDQNVTGGDDCDDTNLAYNPAVTWYDDTDGDGYGDANISSSCEPINASDVSNDADCDVSNGNIYPSAPELCDGLDNDCDLSLPTNETDDDNDGFVECFIHADGWFGASTVIGGQDCDDSNPTMYPSATEACDGVDNDCDYIIPTEEQDPDGDGFIQCEIDISGWQGGSILGDQDCNPTNGTVHPGAPELCDGLDNNCDLSIPINETDDDNDGFVECSFDVNGWDGDQNVTGGDDCDDTNPSYNPAVTWYADADGDSFGDAGTANDCERLNPTDVTDNTDCNDNSANSYVGAIERCDGLDNDCDLIVPANEADVDGDTYVECAIDENGWMGAPTIIGGEDCDDGDAAENPGVIWYADGDGDSFGDAESSSACEAANSTDVRNGSDCDDDDPAINIIDIDGDGYSSCFDDCWDSNVDTDGDGIPDSAAFYPGAAAQEPDLCTIDADGDGYGDAFPSAVYAEGTCFQLGLVDTGSYWDLAEISVYVEGSLEGTYTNTEASSSNEIEGYEICLSGSITLSYDCTSSYDCDNHTWYVTFDSNKNGDYSDDAPFYSDGNNITGSAPAIGTSYTLPYSSREIDSGTDCDDADATTIGDNDGDGFTYCTNDCNDSDPAIRPDAIDICDGVDQNCSGDESDVAGSLLFYMDIDGDGFGNPNEQVMVCEGSSEMVINDLDCDDTNPDIHPNALEICDLIDNDCDLAIDQADPNFDSSTLVTYYEDIDGDGYGATGATGIDACEPPIDSGTGHPYASNDEDCDDSHVSVYLHAPELCDGIDNDCDGDVDDKPSDAVQYFLDADGDGYGDDSTMVIECSDPSDSNNTYVTQGGDCDDSDTDFHPGAVDTCDGLDQNCSGDESDVAGNNIFYIDLDGDGFGNPTVSILACEAPNNFVTDNTDCDDKDPMINLDAIEICDGVDNDCNGDTDQNDANLDSTTLNTYYLDADNDGFGDLNFPTQACFLPTNYTENNADCNDDDSDANGDGIEDGSLFHPDVAEIYYDGIDQNCDGLSDFDQDMDGDDDALGGGSDCDDLDPSVNSFDADGDGVSTCDGDCNDSADDLDSDGFADGMFTYPGAAYNEINAADCLTDYDGDGWSGQGSLGCFEFDTFDSYGDGWNGNAIEIYEDGVLTATIENQNLDGAINSSSGGEYNYLQHCFDSNTENIELYYVDGGFNYEISFEMFDASGTLLGSGQGVGSTDLIFNSTTYVDGDLIYSASAFPGSDCDDSDNTIGMLDNDLDGSIDCIDDCDPLDQNLNANDLDGDGYSTCDGDCDDNNDSIHPNAFDAWYDGIDADCAGNDDYDQDGDGDIALSNGGTDCDDTNPDINIFATEICDGIDNNCDGDIDLDDTNLDSTTLTTYYLDADNDGFGTPNSPTQACFLPADHADNDADCNDSPNDLDGDAIPDGTLINPNAAEIYYDGIDQNCDGLSDYDQDMDGDDDSEYAGSCSDIQYSNQTDCENVSETWTATGTDCDDSSAELNGLDLDGDGVSICDGDCDDSADDLDGDGFADGMFTYPGAAYNEINAADCLTDYDGDGWAGQSSLGCFDFNTFDSYGDGWNGNAIEIYEDGVLTATIENQNLDGAINSSSGGEYNYLQHCFDSNTENIELYYVDGGFNYEISFEMFDASGTLLGSGQGVGSTDLIFNSTTYVDGDLIYSASASSGNDCDDTDPNLSNEDGDGDGVSACTNDCDDNDPLNAGTFAEDCTDGQDNDCDGQADCDDSDCAASCFELDCADGLDGDGDGDIDCLDSDCTGDVACIEICDDGQDNDSDGDIDCGDSDCAGDIACIEDCTDGQDNDNDGDIDCLDADCAGDIACIEICDDGQDNDGDGDIDCLDSDCDGTIDCEYACLDLFANDLGDLTGIGIITGTNAGEGDDTEGDCSTAAAGEDVSYAWTAPATGTYTFSTAGSDYDTVLYISESCVSENVDCNDDVDFSGGDSSSEIIDLYVFEGEELIVTIDAFDDFEAGTYSLDIFPTFEQLCDDGLDDDGDGVTDCADSDCSFNPACATLTCPNFDLGTAAGTVMNGSFNGALNDHFDPTCVSTSNNDFVIAWEADDTGCATFETTGSLDTVLALFDDCPSAGGIELSCNDDGGDGTSSLINLDVTAGTIYYIGLDTYTAFPTASYGLDINVASGVSCN